MSDLAVVLVHGLFSSQATWSDIDARIGEDPALGVRCDLFHMTYASPRVRLHPLRAIPDYDVIADDMATFLDVEVAGYAKVALVGHSQGGLIIQRYLARMVGAGRARDLARIKAVVMFACPNSGSELGILFRRVAKFWFHPQERQLRPLNEKVAEAHRVVVQRIQYAATVDAQNCPIPIHVYAGTTDKVVTPTSARGAFPNAKALPGDHFSIIEAKSLTARTFTALRSHLLTVLGGGDPGQKHAGITVVGTPAGTTVVGTPAETTVVGRPAETTVVGRPAETTAVGPPSGMTAVDTPTGIGTVDTSAGMTMAGTPTGTAAEGPPTEAIAGPPTRMATAGTRTETMAGPPVEMTMAGPPTEMTAGSPAGMTTAGPLNETTTGPPVGMTMVGPPTETRAGSPAGATAGSPIGTTEGSPDGATTAGPPPRTTTAGPPGGTATAGTSAEAVIAGPPGGAAIAGAPGGAAIVGASGEGSAGPSGAGGGAWLLETPVRTPVSESGAGVAVRHNLVRPSDAFFDRVGELRRVLEGLASHRRVVSISGLGGMGKSALANRTAWRCVGGESSGGAPCFDTIVWCDRSTGRTLDALLDTVSRVLGYPHLRALPMPDKLDRAVERINDERCLLILDDFDDTCDRDIPDFLARIDATRSKVLVTARQRYSGEAWSVDIGGLDEPARRDLVLEEAHRLGMAELTRGSLDLMADYLAATGGNPFAIRLTLGQIRYGDELNSVTAHLRSASDAALFDAIFDRTWHRLLAEFGGAETIILCIALHPASVSREAIEFVLDARGAQVSREIRRVVDASLVDIVRGGLTSSGRFRLHPLTRAYALRRLAGDERRRACLQDRLIRYYRDFAVAEAEVCTRADRVRALEIERDNVVAFAEAAFARAMVSRERTDLLDVVRYAEAMAGFLWGRGYWRDRLRLCGNAASAAEAAGEAVALARQCALIGRVHVRLGDYAEAARWLARSEAALPRDASGADRRETIRLRAHIASRTGDPAAARALYRTVLESAAATADDEGRAATLVELGMCAVREGELADAIATFEQARRLDEQAGAVEGMAITLSHLAHALYESENLRDARPLFERGLELATRVNRPSTRGRCHLGLAGIEVSERRFAEAGRHAAAAGELFGLLGMAEPAAEAALIAENLPRAAGEVGPPRPTVPELLAGCRAVVFDFDDTLAATMRARWPVLRRTAAEFGVELEISTIRAAWGRPFDALVRALVPTVDPAVFVPRYREAMAAQPPRPTPAAVSVLRRLRQRGVSLSIVGSGSRALIVQDLAALGVLDCFDEVRGCEQSEVHKPDPRVLHPTLTALSAAGIARAQVLYIGDSVRDHLAATGNGVAFLAVLTGLETREDFLRAGLARNLVLGSLSQLRMWL
ncbi:alpha/beta fold hydrolase [Nocardia terpenica]|uniref:alpha/beta fold hydrolase n=1 Tax=Nocardia terpenica TaxID=455432 RepID=UPI001895AA41|nr:alpha/beta fold hydrolase [Nocardia terpenica]MBF6061387.1 alpha/beta fold hydrolase [Nocardia terpenica]MBF6105384.1 alpha/beta fold hydrolase [Nocardia terpenica]MBF6113146.1 alpha/beta fold hydrolase [Nocardia terpenica]MBF6119276.1 alpha/beta fold hydrolase [Nocardia terpenica]MBF6152924.1 alpha/beta fold hydrolase [Nocardia terpenica]